MCHQHKNHDFSILYTFPRSQSLKPMLYFLLNKHKSILALHFRGTVAVSEWLMVFSWWACVDLFPFRWFCTLWDYQLVRMNGSRKARCGTTRKRGAVWGTLQDDPRHPQSCLSLSREWLVFREGLCKSDCRLRTRAPCLLIQNRDHHREGCLLSRGSECQSQNCSRPI